MNKYFLFYFFALLAIVYAQSSTKSLPSEEGEGNTGAKSLPESGTKKTKLPPSEFFGTDYPKMTATKQVPAHTKTLPPSYVTSSLAAAQATETPESNPAKTLPSGVVPGNSTATDASSSASKVVGTYLAAIVAVVAALF